MSAGTGPTQDVGTYWRQYCALCSEGVCKAYAM